MLLSFVPILCLLLVEPSLQQLQHVDISPPYRPVPAIDDELKKNERTSKLEFLWCTIENCNTPLTGELNQEKLPVPVVIVIQDIEVLFQSRTFAEKIAIGAAKMNFWAVLVLWDKFQPNYYQAVANSHGVAKQIAAHLVKAHRKVHLIGLGVGAHIAGYVGKRCKAGSKIEHITALDPARILFEYNEGSADLRLDKEDANFVDVIHSDYKGKMRVGCIISIGHADFYENGGTTCLPVNQRAEDSMQIWQTPLAKLKAQLGVCKHNTAIVNYIAAMSKKCSLYAVRNQNNSCEDANCLPLGFMTAFFLASPDAGGGLGNYIYNASECYEGVPSTTQTPFKKIYDDFQAGSHPLIDEESWLSWLENKANTVFKVVLVYIKGVVG